jgi:predicted nucleotidyltransferase
VESRTVSISEISKIVAPIAREYGIGKLAVFGSYVRGEANNTSDIDFHIIDRGTLRGMFRLAGFELALEEKLTRPVDVVTTDSLFDDVLQNVEREELVIYER